MNVQDYSSEALKQLQAFADREGINLMKTLQESGYDVEIREDGFGKRYLRVVIPARRYSGTYIVKDFTVATLYEQPLDPFVYINKEMLGLVKDKL